MKRKVIHALLGWEAALCLVVIFARSTLLRGYAIGEMIPRTFSMLMAFPFQQLGLGLRTLSLSGKNGNLLALVIYAAFCLTPLVALFLARRKRRLYPEDALLAILSVILFIVLYFAINPGLLPHGVAAMDSGTALLGSVAYSVLTGYIVLRALRSFFAARSSHRLQEYLAILLYILNALFVFMVFGAYFSNLLDSWEALRAANTDGLGLGTSYLFLVLQYLVNALPYALNILVVFAVLDLLQEQATDSYSEGAVMAAEKLSRFCGLALVAGVVSNLAFNLLQLLFLKNLRVINSVVQVPLFSIIFVLATLLLAQYIKDSKQIKEDNSMFI